MEGVVAIKSLTNNLLAVVYSNGLLRVYSISEVSVIVETNILLTECDTEFDRIVDAQVNFKSHTSIVADDLSISKTISIGVSFTAESSRKLIKQNGLHVFNLKFNNIQYDQVQAFSQKEDERNEQLIDLASGVGDSEILTHI